MLQLTIGPDDYADLMRFAAAVYPFGDPLPNGFCSFSGAENV
jgi:hypothetical protein